VTPAGHALRAGFTNVFVTEMPIGCVSPSRCDVLRRLWAIVAAWGSLGWPKSRA